MINLHPSEQQLRLFVEGNMDPAMALVTSAHLDMCKVCQHKAALMQESAAQELTQKSVSSEEQEIIASQKWREMCNAITDLPQEIQAVPEPRNAKLELDGRTFTLPRALSRYADKTGDWSRLLGNIYQAPVDLGPIGKANFIFMQKGGRVPEHTHKGKELTLVIDGEFSDGIAHYDSGDFIVRDASHKHAPYTDADEGCLVFSIVDQPLHFTSGIARLLNPFSHLFF